MHIFLTGEIMIGKTVAIEKTISILGVVPGGFKTYFGPDRDAAEKDLYMNPAAEPMVFRKENAIVHFTDSFHPQILTDRFETYGVSLIRKARNKSKLIVMDECGFLERDAVQFQREILSALDGSIPVLGVIKLASIAWTTRIRNHPNVKIITVDRENRDSLPPLLARRLAFEMGDEHLIRRLAAGSTARDGRI